MLLLEKFQGNLDNSRKSGSLEIPWKSSPRKIPLHHLHCYLQENSGLVSWDNSEIKFSQNFQEFCCNFVRISPQDFPWNFTGISWENFGDSIACHDHLSWNFECRKQRTLIPHSTRKRLGRWRGLDPIIWSFPQAAVCSAAIIELSYRQIQNRRTLGVTGPRQNGARPNQNRHGLKSQNFPLVGIIIHTEPRKGF